MNVSAEIRDFKKLIKLSVCYVSVLVVMLILWIVTVLLTVYVNRVWVIPCFVMLLVMLVAIVIEAVLASKAYKNTWKTELFELVEKNGCLTYKGQKLHTNYNKRTDSIYVHDLGDAGNPAKASIYLTVFGEDKERLMDYIRENDVKIEEESFPEGRGRFAAVTNLNLTIGKYRRR